MANNVTQPEEHPMFFYVQYDEISWNGAEYYTLGQGSTHVLLGLGSIGYLGDEALLCHMDNSTNIGHWKNIKRTGLKAPEGKVWKEEVVNATDLRPLAKELQQKCQDTYGPDWRKRWPDMEPVTIRTQFGPMCAHFVQGLDDPTNEFDENFDRDVSVMLEKCAVPTRKNMNLEEEEEGEEK